MSTLMSRTLRRNPDGDTTIAWEFIPLCARVACDFARG